MGIGRTQREIERTIGNTDARSPIDAWLAQEPDQEQAAPGDLAGPRAENGDFAVRQLLAVSGGSTDGWLSMRQVTIAALAGVADFLENDR